MTVKLTYGEKVTADKSTLNHIAIAFGEAATRYAETGCNGLAKRAESDAHLIYEALDAVHFYDSVREEVEG